MLTATVRQPTLSVDNRGNFVLRSRFEDRELAKSIPGARWDAAARVWRYPARFNVARALLSAFPGLRLDPGARILIRDLERRDEEVRRLKAGGDVDCHLPVLADLYQHQKRMAAMALEMPSFAFLCDMGTGKTLAAIAVAGERYERGEIIGCLIVCPKSVMSVWQEEFRKFAGFTYELRLLDGSISEREAALARPWRDGDLRVAVVNYEATWRMEEALARFAEGQMVIADESHRIKTPSAKQAKAMHRLGRRAAYRLMLTGTPITQAPLDVYSQYKFLDPTIYGDSFTAFRNRYAIMGGYGGYEVVGYRDLDDLAARAYSIAYRVTRAECLDLPPEIVTEVPVQLGRESREVYWRIRSQAVAELEALERTERVTTANVLTQLLRLQQVAGGFVGTDSGHTLGVGTEKLDAAEDLLEDLLAVNHRKVVVFCRFLPEIAALVNRLRKTYGQETVGELHGETADRGELVRRFQGEENPRVLVVQIQTGGLGITLHRADTAVFYSTGWSLADYEQAKARIQRAGQTAERVQYFHLVAKGTVDEQIYDALRRKRNLAETVEREWRKILGVTEHGSGVAGNA